MWRFYIDGIEHDADECLDTLVYAGATISDVALMIEGFSFTGNDGNIYEIEEE